MHACLTQHNTLALERHVGFVMHFVHCTCIIVCTIRAKKSEPYGFVLWGGEGGGCESDKDRGRRSSVRRTCLFPRNKRKLWPVNDSARPPSPQSTKFLVLLRITVICTYNIEDGGGFFFSFSFPKKKKKRVILYIKISFKKKLIKKFAL